MGWFEQIFATLQEYWAILLGMFGGVTGLLLFLSMLKNKREEIKARIQSKSFTTLIADVKSHIEDRLKTVGSDIKELFRLCQENNIELDAFVKTMLNTEHNIGCGIKDLFEQRKAEIERALKGEPEPVVIPEIETKGEIAEVVSDEKSNSISLE